MFTLPFEADTIPPKLAPLFEAFCRAPFEAAPEKSTELKSLVDESCAKICVGKGLPDWKFEELSFGPKQIISTNHRTLERIWCYCYSFNCIISEIALAGPGGYSAIKNKSDFGNAFQLLKWAMQDELVDVESEWPEALPSPDSQNAHVSSTNEMFTFTSARILLHEIGHAVVNNDNLTAHEQEFLADAWADNWMLSQVETASAGDLEFAKRSLGISFSHIPLLLTGKKQRHSNTHPPSGQRVLKFVQNWFPRSTRENLLARDSACGHLVGIMTILLYSWGYKFPASSLPNSYLETVEAFAPYFY